MCVRGRCIKTLNEYKRNVEAVLSKCDGGKIKDIVNTHFEELVDEINEVGDESIYDIDDCKKIVMEYTGKGLENVRNGSL